MNRRRPIDKFPLDLLLDAFFYLVQDPLPRDRGDMVHPPLRAMLYVTQVCRQWRKIALRSPSLWVGCVDLGRPEACIEEMLRRSRDRPLNLTFFTSSTNPKRRKALAPANQTTRRTARDFLESSSFPKVSSRTVNGSLHAILPAKSCEDDLALLQQCLSKLKTICLEVESTSATFRDPRIFKGKGWLVQSLSMTRCRMALQPAALTFLLDLRIASLCAKDCLGVKAWLDMCAGLPQLQVLELVDCFKSPLKTSQNIQDSMVNMPNLQALVISTPHHHNCLRFLEALVIPSSCDLTLRTTIMQRTLSCKYLLALLSERYNASEKAFGDDIYIAVTERVLVWRTQGNSAPASVFIQITFKDSTLSVAKDCPTLDPHKLYLSMLKLFRDPIASVRTLTLSIFLNRQRDFHPFFNPAVLLNFPRLVKMELDLANIFGGPPPLDVSAFPDQDPSTPRMTWFPSRRELLLENADFLKAQSERYSLAEAGRHRKRKYALCQTLKDHLESGRNGWNPEWDIKTVILRKCAGIGSRERREMEEWVGIDFEVI
ncbi:hypothetical protein M413DRAFT_23107 [Hebeloma cylindrosporum]|uniref:F-box domain-containing protein n=1 Tax=Hebeloma cylindrosporum TaxID=76867 RepID=A0A0C2YA92_HEBCY|nr:hypothetical protein M413DRAFT_23107 [Hebeloma cylindrosporum h7]